MDIIKIWPQLDFITGQKQAENVQIIYFPYLFIPSQAQCSKIAKFIWNCTSTTSYKMGLTL